QSPQVRITLNAALLNIVKRQQHITRLLKNTLLPGESLLPINNHSQWLALQSTWQINACLVITHSHRRIVDQYGIGTRNNGTTLGAQTLHILACRRTGNPLAFTTLHGSATIQALRQLKCDLWQAGTHTPHKTSV